ncbi:MAG: hypothetical protein HFJ09_16255 [Lachnospiraceae bacterium]|nr:hypothetical protein [Lachnospiraceae bacterium]
MESLKQSYAEECGYDTITIEGTIIELGDNIQNIKLNGEFGHYEHDYHFCDSCLHLATDKKGNIKEITCFCGVNDCLEVYFKQYNLSKLEVVDAVKVMNTILEEEVVLTENNSSYDWEKSEVYAWQEVTREAAEELLEESIQEGIYQNMKEDIERSKHFSSITIR